MRGDAERCRRHIGLAEDAYAEAERAAAPAGWLANVGSRAHLFAVTGHAAAALVRRAGEDPTSEDARQRLARAVELLDPLWQARPAALCLAQLATLRLEAGDLDNGGPVARRALAAAASVHSVRLRHHLAAMRAAAAGQDAGELVAEIDGAIACDRSADRDLRTGSDPGS